MLGSLRRIWIDTDLALGAPTGDIDDGFAVAAVALAAALYPREVELLGVSTVAGNAPARRAHECAIRLLAALGSPVVAIPAEQAPQALLQLPPGSSLLAIGPPHNLVAAATRDPTWAARTSVRVVGTVSRPWRHPFLRCYCLNFARGREVAEAFFRLQFRERRLFPLDIVRQLRVGAAELDALRATGSAGAYLADHSGRWLRQARWRYRSRSFPVWDLVAALDAIGRLPGSALAADGTLRAFEAAGAWSEFLALLRRSRHYRLVNSCKNRHPAREIVPWM
jgi:inosine-uridine nucleoside N-ribohydrolase